MPNEWAAGDYDGAGPVSESRRVSRSHFGRVRLWRQLGQLLGSRVGPDTLVVLERPCGQLLRSGNLDRMDLQSKPPRVARGRSPMVRKQRERVDLLAGQSVAVRHVLCRLDHLDVNVPGQQHRVGRSPGPGPHGVEEEYRTAWAEGGVAFHLGPARARHRLDACCQSDLELATADGMGNVDGTGQR
jgi:hypothetical protein